VRFVNLRNLQNLSYYDDVFNQTCST